MEGYTSRKIYINPHFNRNSPIPSGSGCSDKTYINLQHPSFNLGNRKIYLNPKFLPPNPIAYIENNILVLASQQNQSVPPSSDIIHKSRYSLVKSASFINANKQIAQANKEKKKEPPIDYSDTRQYRNITLTYSTPPVNASLNTFNYTEQPINMNEDKYNAESSDVQLESLMDTNSPTSSTNRFKYVRSNHSLVTENPVNNLNTCYKCKKMFRIYGKKKAYNKNFRLNKIPCRIFTKFGKCFRFNYGKCKFLHDKKYVALCKRFLKGTCYDLECPLSHELSYNKMPTCYFYLKGACTKEVCPYLHIKLSDKAKICKDFLKGYCENADMCSFRHVNQRKPKKFRNKKLIRSISYNSGTFVTNNFNIRDSIVENNDDLQDEKSEFERRYYNETFDSEDDVKLIQPSRTRLGTLPSFIHL